MHAEEKLKMFFYKKSDNFNFILYDSLIGPFYFCLMENYLMIRRL